MISKNRSALWKQIPMRISSCPITEMKGHKDFLNPKISYKDRNFTGIIEKTIKTANGWRIEMKKRLIGFMLAIAMMVSIGVVSSAAELKSFHDVDNSSW